MFPTITGVGENLPSRSSWGYGPLSEWPKRPWSSLVSLLGPVIAAEALPDWSAAQWVAVLRAPQASQRVSRSAAERGLLGAAVLGRPEVDRLLVWVRAMWPDSLPAMAGALAAARQVQVSGPVDLDAAAGYVIGEIRRARSRRYRTTRERSGLVLLDPAELRAVEPPAAPPVAPGRVADAFEWMVGFVPPDIAPPAETCLDIEASMSVFLDWYVDRLATPPGDAELAPIPPSRTLIPKKRLSARVTDAETLRLLAGPPGSRRCPTEQSWQQGMGYWAIVALVGWARGVEPPEPSKEARQWWSGRLRVLAARPKTHRGVVAADLAFLEQRRQAM